jgi:hypothetical protein
MGVSPKDKCRPTPRGLGRRVYSISAESNFAIRNDAVVMNNNSYLKNRARDVEFERA